MTRRYTGGFLSGTEQATDANTANGIFSLSDAAAATTAGAFPTGRWTPQRSLRFRASVAAYLNRTYGTPTNNKVWTWSAWVKRGSLSLADANHLFLASPTDVGGNPSTYARLVFETDGTLRLQSNFSASEAFTSSALFRDPAAWYHIVLQMDAVNTTVRCYVNGAEITYASKTNPTNTNTAINGSGNYHRMGLFRSAELRPFDGYMADVNFIDGQALTPSAFGITDPQTGTWVPKRYSGTYGNNGFYLDFRDNTAATASTIGADRSGNGNNWTPNNISVATSESISVTYTTVGSGSWTPPPGVTSVNYLVLGGGGAGGSAGPTMYDGGAAGGGAGGMLYGTQTVVPGQSYTITVGAGGAGAANRTRGASGTDSVFGSLIAYGGGGGGGGANTTSGANGGSGGGGANGGAAGTGTAGQGNNGGFYVGSPGNGGGGAGAVGGSASNNTGAAGGNGLSWPVNSTTYAAGGGGGGYQLGGGSGGSGGGGAGGSNNSNGSNASNYGCGGGGSGGTYNTTGTLTGGAGYNGLVVLSYTLADSTYDSMVDVPGITNPSNQPDVGGVTRGNYATLNPLANGTNLVCSQGNLVVSNGSTESNHRTARSTMGVSSGKWYWEVYVNNSANVDILGIVEDRNVANNYVGAAYDSFGWGYSTSNGAYYGSGTWVSSGTAPAHPSSGLIGIALDLDAGKIWFSSNGTWLSNGTGVGNPSIGANPVAVYNSVGNGTTFFPAVSIYYNTGSWNFNFGQRPFKYTPPAGFKTLNTANLPNPSIKRPSDHFDTKLWTGNGTSLTVGTTSKQTNTTRVPGSARFTTAKASFMTKSPSMANAVGGSLSTVYNYTIAADTNNYSLYNTARAAGYDGKSIATFNLTINASVVVGSVSNLFPALDLSGFPSGTAINVTIGAGAYVVGAGGSGGNGGGWPTAQSAMAGGNGGDAIWASSPVSITNNGTVAGGGGGAGGSEGWAPNGGYGIGGGGGGGGAGRIVGTGGGGAGTSAGGTSGGNANAGTLTTGGSGGAGGYHSGYTAGAGGTGGNLGAAGSNGAGSPGNWNGSNYNPGLGGAAGYYVRGTANVTWVTNGTRAGSTQVLPQKYSGSGTTWTWSAWVKRTKTGTTQRLFTCANASGDDTAVRFETDKLRFYNSTQAYGNVVFDIKSNADYADTNWHHIVAVCDTTNANAYDRVRLYMDGARVTSFATNTVPSLNQISTMNWNIPQYLGIYPVNLADETFDGSMSEVNYVDGLALDPSSFGTFDANNNWYPKSYSGSYGAAGYYLPFNGHSLGDQNYSTPQFNSNSQSLSIADNAALDMGSSDFTMECFYFPVSLGSEGTAYSICGKRTAGGYGGFIWHASLSTSLLSRVVATVNGSTWGVDMTSSIAFVPYVWNHLALTRNGNVWTMWINGQKGATTTVSGTIPDNSAPFVIGNSSVSDSALLTGKISNFRLVKGTALYTVPFTPPTTALTAVANTVLLTCQNGTYVDNSTNAFTVTPNSVGNPQIAYPFSVNPTYSAYFATNRSLSVNGFTPNLSTIGNFTIEMYAYIISYATSPVTLFGNTTNNSVGYVYSTGSIGFGINGINEFVSPAGAVQSSVWNHIAYVKNGTNLTIYVNGIAVATTSSASTYLANTTPTFLVGNQTSGGTSYPFNGVISNFRFVTSALYTAAFSVPTAPLSAISGTQLLTCADAGIRDLSTNNYVITNTNTVVPSQSVPSSVGITADASGVGNHFASNMTVGVGAINQDWDWTSPTDYEDGTTGIVRGNYAVLGGRPAGNASYPWTLYDGNLRFTCSYAGPQSTLSMKSGKWYWETTGIAGASSYNPRIGIINKEWGATNGTLIGDTATSYGYCADGSLGISGSYTSSWGSTYTDNDVIGIAFDADSGKLWFSKNGTWQASGNPAAGTNPATIVPNIYEYVAATGTGGAGGGYQAVYNFGQRAFNYAPPTGFKALNTKNLADAGSYNLPDNYGNFVNTPDLIWIKNRTSASGGGIWNTTSRAERFLQPTNGNGYATTSTQMNYFAPNGFVLGADGNITNNAGNQYVGWLWNKGKTPGFDIATWLGTGSSTSQVVAHKLGAKPKFIISKVTNTTNGWMVYHGSLGGEQSAIFNGLNAFTAQSDWNNTEPNSSTFSVYGANNNTVNNSYIAYLWSEVPGFSKFGSYTGNGSTSGPFVYCGFRPRWILLKQSSNASVTYGWQLYDTARSPNNVGLLPGLWVDTTAAEAGATYGLDILSNGFRITDNNANMNTSNYTYVYAAFAEAPFKYANAR